MRVQLLALLVGYVGTAKAQTGFPNVCGNWDTTVYVHA
jgi:hypothetical protein